MKVKLNSIGFDADEKLVQFVNKKVEKLNTIYEKIVDTEVFLSLNKCRTPFFSNSLSMACSVKSLSKRVIEYLKISFLAFEAVSR